MIRKTARPILSLMLLIGVLFTATAQNLPSHFAARKPGWMTFGLDAGMAFQSADVSPVIKGWGFGATLGKNLFYAPGAPVSFDLRGRLMMSRTFGLDSKRSYGLQYNKALNGSGYPAVNYLIDKSLPNDSSFVYPNYRSTMGELGLEGVLTLNRLREKSGVVLSVFGGVGLDLYRTKTNQLGPDGLRYNYLTINNNGSPTAISQQLSNILDYTYETPADGSDRARLGIMPSAGLELGYQFSPRFVMGLGYKLTFSLTDYLDGQVWNNANQATGNNDLQHYISLNLRWDIEHREHQNQPPVIQFPDPLPPPIPNPGPPPPPPMSHDRPEVRIVKPDHSPFRTEEDHFNLIANIRHVHDRQDIRLLVNGTEARFAFSEDLEANIPLREGSNRIRIEASNREGQTSDEVEIIRRPPQPPSVPRPVVTINQPRGKSEKILVKQFLLKAKVENVDDQQGITVFLNGQAVNNPDFERRSHTLTATLNLRRGDNDVTVRAHNPSGDGEASVLITFGGPPELVIKPEVTITEPLKDAVFNLPDISLKATLKNVTDKSLIAVFVNEVPLKKFDISDPISQVSASLKLKEGDNTIKVRGTNAGGSTEATVKVSYKPRVVPTVDKPVVLITQPKKPGINVNTSIFSFEATVKGKLTKDKIRVTVNNKSVLFEYDPAKNAVKTALNLNPGSNIIKVEATNEGGTGSDQTEILLK
jgi:hypothetical protein